MDVDTAAASGTTLLCGGGVSAPAGRRSSGKGFLALPVLALGRGWAAFEWKRW